MEVNITRNDAAADQVTALRSHNPFASMSQLPTELLVATFQLSLPEIDVRSAFASSRSHVKRLYIMRSVTKRWQAVIERTPSFWTTIALDLPSHVNEASILRSSNLPLSVLCYNPQSAHLNDSPSVTEFYKLIQHTRPRWSTLNLELFDQTAVSSFLGSPLPLLQTITITGPGFRRRRKRIEPLELLGGDTFKLRSVYLSGVSIRWRTGCFVQLKCLVLRSVTYDSPTAQPLLDALHASPGLQVLYLTCMGGMDITQPSPTIALHHLKRIVIEYCGLSLVQCILGRIQAPSCTALCLTLIARQRPFDVPHILDGTLESFHPNLRNVHRLRGGSEVGLHSSGLWWRTQYYPGEESFSIYVEGFVDPFFTDWVDRTLQDEPGPTIIFGDGLPSGEAVLRSVAPMRRVTKVAIGPGSRGEGVSSVLQFLSKPLTTNHSLPSLPSLQTLHVRSTDWNVLDLLEMVQSRFCTLGWQTMERTPLTINVVDVLEWGLWGKGGPGLLVDLATLVNIRSTSGVERFDIGGRKDPEGTLAVVWNEEACETGWV